MGNFFQSDLFGNDLVGGGDGGGGAGHRVACIAGWLSDPGEAALQAVMEAA